MFDLETILLAGFALGLVHSLEPDHLAAMSTLVTRTPRRRDSEIADGADGRGARDSVPGLRRRDESTLVGRPRDDGSLVSPEFWMGAAWAAGHAVALAAVGAALLWLASGPVAAVNARPFEALVGVALLYLGFVRLRDARRGPHQHRHDHGGLTHAHVHLHPLSAPAHSDAAHAHHGHGAVWLGVLHGLAGSGGLLVVMPALVTESASSYVAYVAAFGLGSVVSMGAFCGLLARFASGLQARSERAGPWVAAATGTLSLGVGTFWLATAVLP